MTKFAKRVLDLDISIIRKMFNEVGPDAINMSLGQTDFDTPENIKSKAIAALAAGKTGYTNNEGIDELRDAVAKKLVRENNIFCESKNVIITAGGSGALNIAIQSLIESGEKVVFSDPGFPSYGALATLAGGVSCPVRLDSDLHLDIEELKKRFSDPKTRVFVLNNPANPTGMVESPETIRAVVECASDAGVIVISDEVYEKFCYENTKFVSAAIFGDNVITINAVSKTYAMTGWRIGFLAASEEIIQEAAKVQQYTLACPTSIAQYAALEAYTGPQESVMTMKAEFEARRNILILGLREMGISVNLPKGAFYAFPRMDIDTIQRIITDTGVIITPGGVFGSAGEGYARISYAISQEKIKEALARMAQVIR